MIQPNYEYTVYYIFLETYLCVICLFHVMYWYCFCSFLWNKRLCSLYFFFRFCSFVSYLHCSFFKIFVIVYSNFFFLYCSKTIFFLVVSVLYCNTEFRSVRFLFGLFLQYKYRTAGFRPVQYYKMPIQIFFSFIYCSFFFFLFVSYLLQLFVSFIFKFCIKKKKQQRLYYVGGNINCCTIKAFCFSVF